MRAYSHIISSKVHSPAQHGRGDYVNCNGMTQTTQVIAILYLSLEKLCDRLISMLHSARRCARPARINWQPQRIYVVSTRRLIHKAGWSKHAKNHYSANHRPTEANSKKGRNAENLLSGLEVNLEVVAPQLPWGMASINAYQHFIKIIPQNNRRCSKSLKMIEEPQIWLRNAVISRSKMSPCRPRELREGAC